MPVIEDGDRRFEAVDERRDPGQLEGGVLSEGINIDLTRGEIETRKGMYATPGHKGQGIAFPVSFPASFDEDCGHGQIYGAIPYTSDKGEDYFILALKRYALRIHDSGTAVLIQYPLNESNCRTQELTDDVEMVQAFDKVYMFRGKELDPLVWDGSISLSTSEPKFVPVQRTNLQPGVEPMPKSSLAIYYLNRLWVLKGKDEVLYSDIGVETDFNITNSFKIDTGSFDSVVGMKAWGDNAIIVFKEKSVDILENLQGDLNLNGTRTRLSGEIGLASPSCITDVGRDLWFLSERGVFSVSQALDNKLQSNAEPLSAPMEPVFRRINWNVKSQFRSAFWENSYYLAVSLDDSPKNNAVIVYSFITQSWHGYHTGDFLDAERMFVNFQNAEKYLYYVSNSGAIFRMYVGLEDKGFPLSNTLIKNYRGGYDAAANLPNLDNTPTPGTIEAGDAWYVGTAGTFYSKAVVRGDILVANRNNATPTNGTANPLSESDWTIIDFMDERKNISASVETRGYGAAELERKQMRMVKLDVSEWNPSYTISINTDGVNEVSNLKPTPITRNRKKYHTTGTPAYDVTNVNDDHGNPYREDYSVDYGGTGTGVVGTVTETVQYGGLGNGVNLDQLQRVEIPKAINVRGEYATVRIDQNQGRIKVHSIKMNGFTYNRPATLQA